VEGNGLMERKKKARKGTENEKKKNRKGSGIHLKKTMYGGEIIKGRDPRKTEVMGLPGRKYTESG